MNDQDQRNDRHHGCRCKIPDRIVRLEGGENRVHRQRTAADARRQARTAESQFAFLALPFRRCHVGLEDAVLDVRTLAPAILDGYSGRLILYPSAETLERYRELQIRRRALEAATSVGIIQG